MDKLYAKLMDQDGEKISIAYKAGNIIKDTMNERGLSFSDIINAASINFSSIHGFPKDKRTRLLLLLNQGIAEIEESKLTNKKIQNQHSEEAFLYDRTKFNNGILAIGIKKFLSSVVSFCEKEAQGGKIEIISVGSGDGAIEEEIIRSYRHQFGNDLHITLIDQDPKFEVDFKTVNELVEERPAVIGNCVLFIFWPVQRSENDDNYDIEAVFKLKPYAVLTVYEAAFGLSGSMSFEKLLHDKSLDLPPSRFGVINWLSKTDEMNYEVRDYELNYLIEEIARQDIFVTPTVGTYIFRMVKLMRNDWF